MAMARARARARARAMATITAQDPLTLTLTLTLTLGLPFFDMSAMDAALETDVTGLLAVAAAFNPEGMKHKYGEVYL